MTSVPLLRPSRSCKWTGLWVASTAGRASNSSWIAHKQPDRCASTGSWRPGSVLDEWVTQEARPISLRQLMVFGRSLTEARLLSSANYVRTELLVRIAHRIRDMQQLPYVVVTNRHIKDVYNLYDNAFNTFRKLKEVKTLEDNDRLCQIIGQNLASHLTVIPKLAMGIIECGGLMDSLELDAFMNTILRSRISRRVIAEQHLSMTEAFKSPYFSPGVKLSESDFIGKVFIKCSAKDVIERCAKAVTALACSTNGPDVEIPEIRVVGHLEASFPYILNHIEYVIGELLRNSVQAIIEQHQRPRASHWTSAAATPPAVEVTVCEAQRHIIFRISDQGSGIPRDQQPYLWSFSKGPQSQKRLENLGRVPRMAATMQELQAEGEIGRVDFKSPAAYQSSLSSLSVRPPNLRLGMGLPLSRVYAEYWAGSLHLHSLEGYGVDAFLQISRLGNQNEQLATRASIDAV